MFRRSKKSLETGIFDVENAAVDEYPFSHNTSCGDRCGVGTLTLIQENVGIHCFCLRTHSVVRRHIITFAMVSKLGGPSPAERGSDAAGENEGK